MHYEDFPWRGVHFPVGHIMAVAMTQFSSPRGVAVDSSGNIYVADTGNNRIQKFDENGNFLTSGVHPVVATGTVLHKPLWGGGGQ